MKNDTFKLFDEVESHERPNARLSVAAPAADTQAKEPKKTRPARPRDAEKPEPASLPPRDEVDHRVRIPRNLERELSQLALDVGTELHCTIPKSFLTAPLIEILCGARKQVVQEAKRAGRLTRPGNDDPKATAEFRDALRRVVGDALGRS